jgi:hypothetical protein
LILRNFGTLGDGMEKIAVGAVFHDKIVIHGISDQIT